MTNATNDKVIHRYNIERGGYHEEKKCDKFGKILHGKE